jgi:hypothetical protein
MPRPRVSMTEEKLRRLLGLAFKMGEADGMRLMLDKPLRGERDSVDAVMMRRRDVRGDLE